jgi:hypothetical protein
MWGEVQAILPKWERLDTRKQRKMQAVSEKLLELLDTMKDGLGDDVCQELETMLANSRWAPCTVVLANSCSLMACALCKFCSGGTNTGTTHDANIAGPTTLELAVQVWQAFVVPQLFSTKTLDGAACCPASQLHMDC